VFFVLHRFVWRIGNALQPGAPEPAFWSAAVFVLRLVFILEFQAPSANLWNHYACKHAAAVPATTKSGIWCGSNPTK
jgi:hypothetical protein